MLFRQPRLFKKYKYEVCTQKCLFKIVLVNKIFLFNISGRGRGGGRGGRRGRKAPKDKMSQLAAYFV